MSLLALCPKFLSLLPRFWMRMAGPILSFSLPCFPGFAFVPRTLHFRKASMEGRFCSWSSSSSLDKFWQYLFSEKRMLLWTLIWTPFTHLWSLKKGATSVTFGGRFPPLKRKINGQEKQWSTEHNFKNMRTNWKAYVLRCGTSLILFLWKTKTTK